VPATDVPATQHDPAPVPTDAERLARLTELLELVAERNPFQHARLAGAVPLAGLEDLARLRFTTKDDLVADQEANPPFGTNLTYPLERYTHLHQTSGTTGLTLRVLDTPEDWAWWRRNLGIVLRAAGVGPGDRVALAYAFGPYIQFWASYEGAQDVGAMVIAIGGMDSLQRLVTMRDYGATTLLCTPTYAVHLARVAEQNDLGDALATVERVVSTGEPGASIPSVRRRIQLGWGRSATTTPACRRSARSPTRATPTGACTCARTSSSRRSSTRRRAIRSTTARPASSS
jgi:phenylacetate-CoA ligase